MKIKSTHGFTRRNLVTVLGLLGLIANLAGCALVPLKTKEYDEIKQKISEYHAEWFFGSDKPYLTDQSMAAYPDRNSLASALSQAYFAADHEAIRATCTTEPLVCIDSETLEVLFRRMHNESIIQSKKEKLRYVEDWYHGKLTDSELEAVLHFEFKFVKGELVLNPSS